MNGEKLLIFYQLLHSSNFSSANYDNATWMRAMRFESANIASKAVQLKLGRNNTSSSMRQCKREDFASVGQA